MIELRTARKEDAEILFPLIYQSRVTETIQWDGPESFEDYRAGFGKKAEAAAKGEEHFFTILEANSKQPIGNISFRPQNDFRADVGLWIGEKYHGKGYGTKAIAEILSYGFEKLGFEKIEATVFVGNTASRRILEKNGFQLEGTIRQATKKRGRLIDEWFLGLTKSEYHSKK